MKNLKVSVKLGLIIVSVVIMVIVASLMSVNDMNQVQDKALETMESSSRQSYDDLIKQQVGLYHFYQISTMSIRQENILSKRQRP